eukprot:CAMPEP_0181169986 /NCGR_PEP_ID=MMETSP1096-20121128/1114_1 /TAXON_ID=156174 ORGANISM="Chrysochromulina ericina, Strain CCMP281" /NCGR_SAMPLE_ID=MMETSP1096 /ASSEMBLY_ACC=CAM_ASM_000453 /LENGTH=61 /DNA_ID=CAMNT_0023257495 /DNA_START=363 /DNA_END=548 /DNA_ORIENTATION=+
MKNQHHDPSEFIIRVQKLDHGRLLAAHGTGLLSWREYVPLALALMGMVIATAANAFAAARG